MYKLTHVFANPGERNLIPEIAFHPDGSRFAVTRQTSNEVVIYCAHTREVQRVYRNPAAMLDKPHGVLFSDQHLIVSNSYGLTRPATLQVYRLDAASDVPVCSFNTPFAHMREAHSMALRDTALYITYCENTTGPGALVTYDFDDDSGHITAARAYHEECFRDIGEPKGLALDKTGRQLFMTYATQRPMPGLSNQRRRLKVALEVLFQRGPTAMVRHLRARMAKKRGTAPAVPGGHNNGVAIFAVDTDGGLSVAPIQCLPWKYFCRLENITIAGDTAVLSDTINGKVYVYNLAADPTLAQPAHTVTEEIAAPHGVKLSPDGTLLVVTNYGLKVENQVIHWRTAAPGNPDKVLVYALEAP